MKKPDVFRRTLERVLPWFDADRYEREREATARVIAHADRIMAEVLRVEQVIRSHRR
jgi:hypothetical protein